MRSVGSKDQITTSIWTCVNGLRIHARVSTIAPVASSPPLVLVHGLGPASPSMLPTAELLAPYYRVYVPDLPGFGESEGPSRALNILELADALAHWMSDVGLGRVVLLGNSVGCQVVSNLAVRHPDRVERVILQGPTVPPIARTEGQLIIRWLHNSLHEPASQTLPTLKGYWRCGLGRAVHTLRYALQDHTEDCAPKMCIPTLVVRGERDTIATQPWVEALTRLLPEGQLRVIPEATHGIVYDYPRELAELTRSFLGQ